MPTKNKVLGGIDANKKQEIGGNLEGENLFIDILAG